jgi:BirA family biotin operon repressor/biotin-[acetyl-CoA-carboxylase] ligase
MNNLTLYSLSGKGAASPPLSPEPASYWGERLYLFDSLPSTNTMAREYARNGEGEGTVFMAIRQTMGEGRLKREWHSPEGGAWFSLILRPCIRAERLSGVTLLFSLWILDYLEELLGKPVHIHWPNDLYIGRKKLCGLLVESSLEREMTRWLVAGIGINVNNPLSSLPPGVQAATLADHAGEALDLRRLTITLLARLEAGFAEFTGKSFSHYLPRIIKKCPMVGHHIEITGQGLVRRALCTGIGPEGQLVVQGEQGEREEIWNAERVSLCR